MTSRPSERNFVIGHTGRAGDETNHFFTEQNAAKLDVVALEKEGALAQVEGGGNSIVIAMMGIIPRRSGRQDGVPWRMGINSP